MLTAILFVLFAYLMGSICSAIIVCKLMGLPDPRDQGSNNPGATNVLRIGGKRPAIITLAGDSIKGVIPVLLAHSFGVETYWLGATALAAFLGHLYPVFFGFTGGKGVATGFGVIFALAWPLGLLISLIWLIVALLFRYSSLAALLAFACAPFICFWLNWHGTALWREYTGPVAILSLLLIYRHRGNIQKLMAGTESRLGQKKSAGEKPV